ncbi:MAG: diguanylate cyclase [Xenococcaceae cyanobacterium MO_188.B19]|nr:diguanylate cyclase [Xenococcaceae cyanobacterium MO_188.B19]
MVEYSPNYNSFDLEELIEVNPPIVDSLVNLKEAITYISSTNSENPVRYNYILIVKESKLVGILTETDIVRLTAANIDLTQVTVEAVMTTELITLKKSDFANVSNLVSILRNNQIRHLPVIGDYDKLEGVITVESICRTLRPSSLLKFRCVKEAITTEVLYAPIDTSMLHLSQMMAEKSSTCVVITEEKPSENNPPDSTSLLIPVGIVTARDIVQFQILGLDLVKTKAQMVMSSPLVSMKITDSLMQVKEQMAKLRVRRLVITGKQGELKGIVSQLNILRILDPTELFSVIETLEEELEEKINQLKQEKELAQVTLQSIGDAVITTDTLGNIVNFNSIAEKLTHCPASEAIGSCLSEILSLVDEHTREPKTNPVTEVLEKKQDGSSVSYALLIARDGTEYIIENSVAAIRDNQEEIIGGVMIFRDVSESRALTHELSWQASHDPLTGLYNRRKFEHKLTHAIALAKEKDSQHVFCYLDLDRFKIVNDTCGHTAGDEILRQVSNIFSQQVRSSDILARLGGDEFGILLYGCPVTKAMKIADKIRQAIDDFRFIWKEHTFSIGVSIGLTQITSDSESLTSIIHSADAACYQAKQQGRNCIKVSECHLV